MVESALVRWGNGQGLRVSKQTMEEAGLSIGDRFAVEPRKDGTVTFVPVRRVRVVRAPDFDALFAGCDLGKPVEDGAGDPVGRETL